MGQTKHQLDFVILFGQYIDCLSLLSARQIGTLGYVRPGDHNLCLHIKDLMQAKIRLHTENQIHRLPGSTIKVCVVVVGGFHCIMWSHHFRIGLKLGCDNYLAQSGKQDDSAYCCMCFHPMHTLSCWHSTLDWHSTQDWHSHRTGLQLGTLSLTTCKAECKVFVEY